MIDISTNKWIIMDNTRKYVATYSIPHSRKFVCINDTNLSYDSIITYESKSSAENTFKNNSFYIETEPKNTFIYNPEAVKIECMNKGRTCKGTDIHTNKLTENNVINIRKDNRESIKIAKDYNITRETVNNIKTYRSWRWLK